MRLSRHQSFDLTLGLRPLGLSPGSQGSADPLATLHLHCQRFGAPLLRRLPK